MKRLIILFLAIAGCGGSDNGDLNAIGNCKLTLSGAMSGTFSCIATAGTQAGGTSVLGVVATESGSLKSFVYSVQVTGDPMTKTYTTDDFKTAGIVLTTTDNKSYFASTGSGGSGTVGSLTVSGLTLQGTDSGTKIYLMKGSTSGTVKLSQGEDTITITATF